MLFTALNWAIAGIGVYLLFTDIRAILYFRDQEARMGRNWVLHEYLLTAYYFTVVYAVIFAIRFAVLFFAPSITTTTDPVRTAGGVITGIALIWLGFKPERQRRLFKRHEGR